MLTIVGKNSALDIPGFLWRGAYIRDFNWVIYLRGIYSRCAYVQGAY